MSADEQRIAIAEACGWKWMRWGKHLDALLFLVEPNFPSGSFVPATRQPGEPYRSDKLPDYPNSLDAMHEAEKTLRAQKYAYALFCHELLKITNPGADRLAREWSADEWENAISATAAQRAEAFLQAIGKFIEPPTK